MNELIDNLNMDTNNIIDMKYVNICRLCMKPSQEINNLFLDKSIQQKILVLSSVEVLPIDNLPKNVCHVCLTSLYEFWAFREQIRRVNFDLNIRLTLRKAVQKPKTYRKRIKYCNAIPKNLTKIPNKSITGIDKTIDVFHVPSVEYVIDELNPIEANVENIPVNISENPKQYVNANNSKNPPDSIDLTENDKPLAEDSIATDPFKFEAFSTNDDESETDSIDDENMSSIDLVQPTDVDKTLINCKLEFDMEYKVDIEESIEDICDDSSDSKSNDIQNEYQYLCDECGELTTTKFWLKHLKTHKEFNCIACNGLIFNYNDYLLHMKEIHNSKPKREPKAKRMTVCEICGMNIVYAGLSSHMQIHQERTFACESCDKKFTSKHRLANHIRSHTQDRPFSCNYCEMRFTIKWNLHQHLRLHTNEMPYKCPYCSQGFRHNVTKKKHIAQNHALQRISTT